MSDRSNAGPAEPLKKSTRVCQPKTALELWQSPPPNLPLIQHATADWLQLGPGLYEIAGEAGTGKTQIALSLCAEVARTASALYLSLGTSSVTKTAQRLEHMAEDRLDKILTSGIVNQDDLMRVLEEDLPILLADHTVKVVVLDSIADLFREPDTTAERYWIARRSSLLFQVATQLQAYAEDFQIPILIVNQVSQRFDQESSVPALGLAWAHCIQHSFMCTRRAGAGRVIRLDRSPRHAPASASFVIATSGVQLA